MSQYLIAPLAYKESGEQPGMPPNHSNEQVVIVNADGVMLCEIIPQQIRGIPPSKADRVAIAQALVEAYNATAKNRDPGPLGATTLEAEEHVDELSPNP